MNIRTVGSKESAEERDRIRDLEREKAAQDRALSSKDRERAIAERNAERKQERESATQSLQSGNVNLQEIARQGGSLGRRIEREVRRFEQTGRVSSWLAGETLKAEAAQNAAQQSAFRQDVVDVVSTSQNPIDLGSTRSFFTPLYKKPELKKEGGEDGFTPPHPFKITSRPDPDTENQFIVTINVGTINGILPSGLLDEVGVRKYSVIGGVTRYVVLTAVTDGRVITGASIAIEVSAAAPQTPTPFGIPTTAQFLIGVVANGSAFNAVNNSILVSGRQQYVEPRTAGPSELPYTIYYVLA